MPCESVDRALWHCIFLVDAGDILRHYRGARVGNSYATQDESKHLMNIFLFCMFVTTVCLLSIGYITIKEVAVSIVCAALFVVGAALVWLWQGSMAGDRALVEGLACVVAVPLILYKVSTYPEALTSADAASARPVSA